MWSQSPVLGEPHTTARLALQVQHNKPRGWLSQAIDKKPSNSGLSLIGQAAPHFVEVKKRQKTIALKKTDTILEWSKMSL